MQSSITMQWPFENKRQWLFNQTCGYTDIVILFNVPVITWERPEQQTKEVPHWMSTLLYTSWCISFRQIDNHGLEQDCYLQRPGIILAEFMSRRINTLIYRENVNRPSTKTLEWNANHFPRIHLHLTPRHTKIMKWSSSLAYYKYLAIQGGWDIPAPPTWYGLETKIKWPHESDAKDPPVDGVWVHDKWYWEIWVSSWPA